MDIASGRADVGDNGCARGGEPQAKISKIYRDSGSTVARSAINYRNITIYNNGAGGGGGQVTRPVTLRKKLELFLQIYLVLLLDINNRILDSISGYQFIRNSSIILSRIRGGF